jgi:hypothetical protein
MTLRLSSGDANYDQSHFVHDFHHLMGMSPREYFASPHVLLDSVAKLRQQAIGQTLQGLHPGPVLEGANPTARCSTACMSDFSNTPREAGSTIVIAPLVGAWGWETC